MWIRVQGPHLKNVDQGSGPHLTAGLRVYLQDKGSQQTRDGAQSRRNGMSILSRHATPPWGLKRIFEMGYSVVFQRR